MKNVNIHVFAPQTKNISMIANRNHRNIFSLRSLQLKDVLFMLQVRARRIYIEKSTTRDYQLPTDVALEIWDC